MSKTNEPSDVFRYYNMDVGPDECWVWTGPWGGQPRNKGRRPYFMANRKRTMAYRWVWELVTGTELTPDQVICHSCDKGDWPVGCGRPSHLSIGTHQDNMDQMSERQRIGLPANVIRAIRTLLERGITQQEIADRYGVSRESISALATGRTYKQYRHID